MPAHLHPGDVDFLPTENLADDAHNAWPVSVAEEDHVVRRGDLGVQSVDLDQVLELAQSRQRATHGDQLPIQGAVPR